MAARIALVDWAGLSRRVLLHHLARGNAGQALSLLRRQLAESGRDAAIGWSGNGAQRWIDDHAPQAHASLSALLAGAAAQRDSTRWWLPLDHLSARVGVMCLAANDSDELAQLEPLVEAVAALVARCAPPGKADEGDSALLRAALHGAGTFVWEWRPDTDALSDIDEGMALLGYDRGHVAPTQEHWNRLIHPDDLADNHEAYLRHERGEVEQYEHVYRARGADGRWHWLHERGRIVERALDGSPRRMLGTQSDITPQRELEMQALADRERLALIARHVPGVLYHFVQSAGGQRGWFAYVSERCEAVFGVPAAELTADAAVLLRRVHPDWRNRLRASLVASATQLAQWRLEFPIRRRDGIDRWLLGAASPQRRSDGEIGWFGYIADVTDLRELEAASRDKAAAEAASRAKTEFLSRMSHELRTPLNAVLGFAQLLELARTPPLDESHRHPVRRIRQAGDHLLTMIGDLLDLTRIEAGQLALQIESVALAPLADECIALLQGQAATAQVNLVTMPMAALQLRCDRTRAKQVLLNLLSNAVKYNRPGGAVTLRAAAARDGCVRIEVADSGVGIAPQHLPRLFEPFQRGAHGQSSIEGTGIGLAVCKSLVELMGGHIDVRSVPGQGSVFGVELPQG
jgi:PAS domain S-box-containing protein